MFNLTSNTQEAITAPSQDKPLNWIVLAKTAIARRWERFWRDIDSRCYPVDRQVTPPDISKPTSLSSKLVADISLLNSKH